LDAWDIADGALRAALRIDPDHIDAHYGMGWVCFERGDMEEMKSHWLLTLEHDIAQPRPEWHLSAKEFDAVAEKAMKVLPKRALALLRDVPIVVEDMPSAAEVEEGLDPRVLGVFCGEPLGEQSQLGPGPSEPNVIKLFQRNLEAACLSREELEEEIGITLLHETAHFFNLSDRELEQIGLG
jgi:predicted Zn-dependent protease with MMP-like domain